MANIWKLLEEMSEEDSDIELSRPFPNVPVQTFKDRMNRLKVIKEILEIVNKLKTWPKKEAISLDGQNTSSFKNFLELLEEITLSTSDDILLDSTKDLKQQLGELCIEVEALELRRLKLLKTTLNEYRKDEENRSLNLLSNTMTSSTSSLNVLLPTTSAYLDKKIRSHVNYKKGKGSYYINSDPVPDPDFLIDLRLYNLKEIDPDVLWTSDMWKHSQNCMKFYGRKNIESELLQYCEKAIPLAEDLIVTKQTKSQVDKNEDEPKTPSAKKNSKKKAQTSQKS